jgi:hypothetical protein
VSATRVWTLTKGRFAIEEVREVDVSSARCHRCPRITYHHVNVTIYGLQCVIVVMCHRDVFWKMNIAVCHHEAD